MHPRTITRLSPGAHDPDSGDACAMEYVSQLAGEPWSDHPATTDPVLAAYVRTINDRFGQAERDRLLTYAPRLLNTLATPQRRVQLGFMCADRAVRVFAPLGLRARGCAAQAASLEQCAPVVDAASARAAAAAAAAAYAYAYAAAADAAAAAAAYAYAYAAAADAAAAARGHVVDAVFTLLDDLLAEAVR